MATGFDVLDVAQLWLDFLPGGRIFTAERIALRNLLEAYLPPETATRRNPFREWVGARLRVDAYGWAAGGDPVAAARMAWHDATVSHTANGVYAAMFMAAAHAVSLGASSAAECADAGLSVIPPQSRLAEAIRTARGLDGEWEDIVDELYARYGGLHGVHAINNTALVAAALYTFDEFSPAICAVVQGGWDTDTNGAAVGSILGALRPGRGALVGAAPWPVRELAAGLRRDHARRARRPHAGSGVTGDEQPFDPLVPRPIDLPTAVPLEGPLDVLDEREDPVRSRRPGGLARLARATRRPGARTPARGCRYDGAAYDLPSLAWTQHCFACALVWLWDDVLYDHEAAPLHARPPARRGRARVRRLRRDRPLACLSGDRDRRAQPVRLLPRRAGDP